MRGPCTETITSGRAAAPNVVYPGLNAPAMVLFYLFHVGGCPLTVYCQSGLQVVSGIYVLIL